MSKSPKITLSSANMIIIMLIGICDDFFFTNWKRIKKLFLQFFIKTRKFTKILEKFTSVSIFRAMPQSSRFCPLLRIHFCITCMYFKIKILKTKRIIEVNVSRISILVCASKTLNYTVKSSILRIFKRNIFQ